MFGCWAKSVTMKDGQSRLLFFLKSQCVREKSRVIKFGKIGFKNDLGIFKDCGWC